MFRTMINIIPFSVFIFLCVLVFVLISYASALASSYLFSSSKSKKEQLERAEITNSIMTILGTGFFVLLAFIIINTWNYQQEGRNSASKEADYLAVMLRSSAVFPPEAKKEIRKAIKKYAVSVRVDEWKEMRYGRDSAVAWDSLSALFSTVQNYNPQTYNEKLYYSLITSTLNNLLQARRDRLSKIDSVIPKSLIDTVLICSIFLAIILGAIRGRDSFINLTPVLLFSALLGFYLAIAFNLDYPYSGYISVSNKVFYKSSLSTVPD